MAKELSDIMVEQDDTVTDVRVRIVTKFPTANFTLSLGCAAKRIQVNGKDLRKVPLRRDFRDGTFLGEGRQTFVAFDLPAGETTLTVNP